MANRRIDFFDGSSSSTTPTMGNISASDLVKYPDDATFEANESGAPIGGNIYYNTTDDVVRYYDDAQAAWVTVMVNPSVDSTFQIVDNVDPTKSFQFEASNISAGFNRVYAMPNEDTTLVGTDATQTITNKTIDGANNVISNLEHGSEVDNPSSGVHGVTGNIVGDSDTQTLTNKTVGDDLDVQGTTSSTNSTTGALTVAGGVGVAENLNVGGNAVITGDLTVNGTTTTIDTATMDVTDANISVNVGGTQATANTNHAGLTVEMSDATDADVGYDSSLASKFHCGEIGSEEEIITSGHTQVLTNKDIDGGTASNSNRVTLPKNTTANLDALTDKEGTIAYDTDQDQPVYNDGTAWLPMGGGGSGAGGINHLETDDAQFEGTSTIWTEYVNAASDKPVDGTGGVPNVSSALNTTTPLRGSQDLKLTKDAGDRQGEGWSIAFTTDEADKTTMQEISFNYSTTANFSYGQAFNPWTNPSDAVVYIYDVTNSNLIQPTTFNLDGSGEFRGYFQAASDSTSYRLIIHVATSNGLAWDMQIDNVRVGPVECSEGDRDVSFKASTNQNRAINNTTPLVVYEIIEKDSHGSYNSSTGEYTVPIAGDYVVGGAITTSAMSLAVGDAVATGIYVNGSFVNQTDAARSDSTTSMPRDCGGSALLENLKAGDIITWRTYSGTASTTSGSDLANYVWAQRVGSSAGCQDDGRPVAASYTSAAGQSIPGGSVFTVVDFGTRVYDTHGAVTTGASWKFTAPVPGYYNVTAKTLWNFATFTATTNRQLSLFKNGVHETVIDFSLSQTSASGQPMNSGSHDIYLDAGDYIDLRAIQSEGTARTFSASALAVNVQVHRIDDNARAKPSDTVVCRVNTTDSQSIPTGVGTIVTFENVDFDSHGTYNASTGVYTCAVAGYYHIDTQLRFQHNSTAINSAIIRKNSTAIAEDIVVSDGSLGSVQWTPNPSTLTYLEAGDTIDVQAFQSTGSNKSLLGGAFANYFNIHRVK